MSAELETPSALLSTPSKGATTATTETDGDSTDASSGTTLTRSPHEDSSASPPPPPPNNPIVKAVVQSPLVKIGAKFHRNLSEKISNARRFHGLPIDQVQEQKLNEMMERLTTDEMDIAARASYEYLLLEQQSLNKLTQQQTITYAKQLALRFLKAKMGNVDKALLRLKETLVFRREQDLDTLRLCLNDPSTLQQGGEEVDEEKETESSDEEDSDDEEEGGDDEEEEENGDAANETKKENIDEEETDAPRNHLYAKKCAQMRMELTEQLRFKSVYVHGFDQEGRSTYIFIPRKVQSHDPDWTLKQHLYTLERAIACSRAPDRTVNAIVDFAGFSMANHAPPTAIGQQFMVTFRNHYAGAVHRIFVLNAPTSFWCLWSLFKPLVAIQTRAKIIFVNTPLPNIGPIHNNKDILHDHYDPDQINESMMEGGLARDFSVNEYLYKTPFDRAFDDVRRDESENLL